MENELIKLKKILNSITDKELSEMSLWIDNSENIKIIAIDNNAISLITNNADIEINGKVW